MKRSYHEISTVKKSCHIDLPLDLTVAILKKLPVKSLLRFQCVSKQWLNITGSRRDFIDSIVARSCDSSMRLIFHHHLIFPPKTPYFVFSSRYPDQDPIKESILIRGITLENYAYVRGLILCWSSVKLSAAIYNPTTRKSLVLPKIQLVMDDEYLYNHVFVFGYDPVKNKYKVLCLVTTSEEVDNTCLVFTLRDRTNKQWRRIDCYIGHHNLCLPAVCIDGVIYYRATNNHGGTFFLVSFDVMSEEFSLVGAPTEFLRSGESTLINYQGMLGFACYEESVEIWVMENAKKQEWSRVTKNSTIGRSEYVFVNKIVTGPSSVYVIYSNPKQDYMTLNGIGGTSEKERERNQLVNVWGVPNHVENTMCLY